jgi:hypothetical protein
MIMGQFLMPEIQRNRTSAFPRLKRRLRKVLIFAFSEFLFYFGSGGLELDTVRFSRTQFWAQQGHFEGVIDYLDKSWKPATPFPTRI